jgi:hypothetical protein
MPTTGRPRVLRGTKLPEWMRLDAEPLEDPPEVPILVSISEEVSDEVLAEIAKCVLSARFRAGHARSIPAARASFGGYCVTRKDLAD